MVIDFHTHSFPDKMASGAIAGLEKSSNTKAVLDGTIDSLYNSSVNAGVDINVLLPIAVTPHNTYSVNKAAIANNKRDRFVSFGSVHPYCKDYKEELKKLADAGIKGIKLHPDFQDVFIDDDKTVELMRCAANMGLLITIHGGMDVSYPNTHHSTPQRLNRVLPQLSGAKIIVAHSGGFQYIDDAIRLMTGKEEIYIDTSYSLGYMEEDKLIQMYNAMNPTHILFGTDSPWDDQKQAIEKIKALNISEELKENILYKNGARLLKL